MSQSEGSPPYEYFVVFGKYKLPIRECACGKWEESKDNFVSQEMYGDLQRVQRVDGWRLTCRYCNHTAVGGTLSAALEDWHAYQEARYPSEPPVFKVRRRVRIRKK